MDVCRRVFDSWSSDFPSFIFVFVMFVFLYKFVIVNVFVKFLSCCDDGVNVDVDISDVRS